MSDDQELTEEELATIEAILEMTREKYECEIVDHDPDEDEYLVVWTDRAGKEWGAWFTSHTINELFTDEVLN